MRRSDEQGVVGRRSFEEQQQQHPHRLSFDGTLPMTTTGTTRTFDLTSIQAMEPPPVVVQLPVTRRSFDVEHTHQQHGMSNGTRHSFDVDLLPQAPTTTTTTTTSNGVLLSGSVMSDEDEDRPRLGHRTRQRFFSAMEPTSTWQDTTASSAPPTPQQQPAQQASSFPSLAALESVLPDPTFPEFLPRTSSTSGSNNTGNGGGRFQSGMQPMNLGVFTSSSSATAVKSSSLSHDHALDPASQAPSFPDMLFSSPQLGMQQQQQRIPLPSDFLMSPLAPPPPLNGNSSHDQVQLHIQMQQALIYQQQQWLLAMQQQQQQQQQQMQNSYGGGGNNSNNGRGSNNNNSMQRGSGNSAARGGYSSSGSSPPVLPMMMMSSSNRNPHMTPMTTLHKARSGSLSGTGSGNTSQMSGGVSEDPLLMEYKTTGKRAAVEDLKGHVLAFALDSHGSRFLQYQMELAREPEKDALIMEILPHAVSLMQDTFGNYVMQNFLEHSSKASRRVLASTMQGSMLMLSMQAHGCRVVQRALDLVELDQRDELLEELLVPKGNVFQASRNTHATHVLQKTVSILRRECAASNNNMNVIVPRPGSEHLMRAVESAIADDVVELLLHPHAYRLVLNVLSDCDTTRSEAVARAVQTVSANFSKLAMDQHGNFMLQHMLDVGGAALQMVHEFVVSRLVELSQHKFGSHLVEKCFSVANAQRCQDMVGELLVANSRFNQEAAERLSREFINPENPSSQVVLALMTDPYANFVVQKALDRAVGAQRNELTRIVQDNAEMLGRFTYGRHILGHVNAMLASTGPVSTPGVVVAGGGMMGGPPQRGGVGGIPGQHPQQQQQPRMMGGRGVMPNPRGYFPRNPVMQQGGGGGGGGQIGSIPSATVGVGPATGMRR